MSWGDLSDDIPGLDVWGPQGNAGDLPPGQSQGQTYTPEVEKHRAWAESQYGNPDDVNKYLTGLQIQYNQDQAPKPRSALATSLADQSQAPEVQTYTGGDNLLSQLRQNRAETGQTAAPTSDFAKLGATSVLLGLAAEPLAYALTSGGLDNPALSATGKLLAGMIAGGVGSKLVTQVPGEQDLPAPIKRGVEAAPYFAAGPGSAATKLGAFGLARLGGEAARSVAPDLGINPEIADMIGMGAGGISSLGYEAILSNPEIAPSLAGASASKFMFHYSPDANTQSIVDKGLNPGSWLAASPEAAVRQARVLGNNAGGTLHIVPVGPGDVQAATTTLGREPAFRSTGPLTSARQVPVPDIGQVAGIGRGNMGIDLGSDTGAIGRPQPDQPAPDPVYGKQSDAELAASVAEHQRITENTQRTIDNPPQGLEDLVPQLQGLNELRKNELTKAFEEQTRRASGNVDTIPDESGKPVSWRDLFNSDKGSVGGTTDQPQSDLEKALQQSTDLLGSDPATAKAQFRAAAEKVASDAQAAAEQARQPYKDTANLRTRASQLTARMNDETGSINNPNLSPGDESSLNYEKAQIARDLADKFAAGASPEEVLPLLKRSKDIETELNGGLVAKQTLPPEQAGLPGVGPGATTQAGPQSAFTPANQQSLQSGARDLSNNDFNIPNTPVDQDKLDELYRILGIQPGLETSGLKDLAAAHYNTTQEPIDASKLVELLRARSDQPDLNRFGVRDANATGFNTSQEPVDQNLLANLYKVISKQPDLDRFGAVDLGNTTYDIPASAPFDKDQLAELYRLTAKQPKLQDALVYYGVSPAEKSVAQIRSDLRQARFWGQVEKYGITPESVDEFNRLHAGDAGAPPPPPPPGNTNGGVQGQFPDLPKPQGVETPVHRAYREVTDLLNAPIALITYGHSPILRQGLGYALWPSHWGIAREALGNMVTVARNPEAWQALNEGLNRDPYVKAAMDAKIFTEDERPALPETVVRKVLNTIPGMENSRESVLAYVTTLRKAGYAYDAAQLAPDIAHLPLAEQTKDYQSLWDSISDVTGHGFRGRSFTVAGVNPVLSPQAFAGRFRSLLDPITQRGSFNPLDTSGRSTAIRNLLTLGVLTGSIEGIAKASGQNLNWNILNTPLGKVQLGASTLDPTAGYGSIARLGAHVVDAINTSTSDPTAGERKGINSIQAYLRGQFGPVSDIAVSQWSGQDWQGKKYDFFNRLNENQLKSGSVLRDTIVPIAANAMWDSIKENGLKGAAIAAPSLGAMSVETNLVAAERDKAAAALGKTGVTGKDGNPLTSFANAMPEAQDTIKNSPAVIKAQGGPTIYQATKQNLEANNPDIQNAVNGEKAFTQSQPLDQGLPNLWHDASIAKRALTQSLSNQFADQFQNFSKSKFEDAVKGYYNTTVQNDTHTGLDYDATAAAKQDYLNQLPPDQRAWVNEALNVSEVNKSDLHKEYDSYIDDKKNAGYFTDGISPSQRAALDRKNPNIDFESWKFSSDVKGKDGNSMESPQAVQRALDSGLSFPVKYADASRPINQDSKSLQAWNSQKSILDLYHTAGSPQLKNAVTAAMSQGQITDYNRLPKELQQKVDTRLRDQMTADPTVEAMLVWWGIRDKPSRESLPALTQLIHQYGPLMPPKKEVAVNGLQ